jgi:hypothetical protein
LPRMSALHFSGAHARKPAPLKSSSEASGVRAQKNEVLKLPRDAMEA